jgi:hypothetical protein
MAVRTGIKKIRAFSFIEVMVTIVIITIGLLPVFRIFSTTTTGISSTIDEVLTMSYANELVDSIISKPYAEIPDHLTENDISAAKSDFISSIASHLSDAGKEYTRGVEIYTDSIIVNPAIIEDMDPYTKEKYDTLKSFRVIKIKVTYKPNEKRQREFNICTIVIDE